jgi:arylsulfatase
MATHEGGISTPLIAHWPAGIAARGELRHQIGHVIDLMPTLVDVAGATYPSQRDSGAILPMEGRSFLPALKSNRGLGSRRLFWEHEGNKAVREGDWKALAKGRGAWELYDLRHDRAELRNLAAQHPEKARELAGVWREWAERCGVWEWDELQKHRQARAKAKKKQ